MFMYKLQFLSFFSSAQDELENCRFVAREFGQVCMDGRMSASASSAAMGMMSELAWRRSCNLRTKIISCTERV